MWRRSAGPIRTRAAACPTNTAPAPWGRGMYRRVLPRADPPRLAAPLLGLARGTPLAPLVLARHLLRVARRDLVVLPGHRDHPRGASPTRRSWPPRPGRPGAPPPGPRP